MKQGCLVTLFIMGGAGWYYYSLLGGTSISDQYWIPGLFALFAGLFFANLLGIFLAFKQKAACNKQRTAWKDGELVGASGIIQANRAPLRSPISHQSAVIAEYSIKRVVRSSKETRRVGAYTGFLMTPCSVQGNQGVIKLIGFPILTHFGEQLYSDQDHYKNAAEFLKTTQFKSQTGNIKDLFNELNQVLSDDDGDVSTHSVIDGENVPLDDSCEMYLMTEGYELSESVVPHGVEVTVFGTFDAKRQALNIGSGLKNMSHSIQLGSMDAVCRGNIIKSVIMTLIFGGIFTGGNIAFFNAIGRPLAIFNSW